jgi:muramoyltetrapeptide carboxypeptidase
MDLVKPNKLREGDNILVVAPSSNMLALSSEAVTRGIRNIEEIGFNVTIHPSCRGNYKGTSGSPRDRAKVLMNAFEDNSVDAIMCFWGGYNSNDLLDYIDWDLIRNNPKIFIGYSDITILNTTFYQQSGLVNFQGPAFITFTHDFLMEWEVQVFKQVLMKSTGNYVLTPSPVYVDDPLYFRKPDKLVEKKPNPGWNIIKEGKTTGRLIGGHIGTLLVLAGTRFWPDFDDKILFVEEDEEGNPKNLRRLFRQLEQIGVLEKIKAFLIGRIPKSTGICDDLYVSTLVEDIIESYNYPIITEMDFGHTNPIATVPMGIKAEISTFEEKLTFLEPCVK